MTTRVILLAAGNQNVDCYVVHSKFHDPSVASRVIENRRYDDISLYFMYIKNSSSVEPAGNGYFWNRYNIFLHPLPSGVVTMNRKF
jgi:hypothetical protein